jgi:hypothetical protein
MLRKPVFWIALVAVSAGSLWFGVRNFSRAFPIVSLDIAMDRATALARAREIDARYRLGPAGYREAASFRGDQDVQNFVELEAGGTPAFHEMFATGRYQPFQWYVRHFREGETREAKIYFTPRGDPYGFSVKLPEKEAGAALQAADARAIAEGGAAEWKVDLSAFNLVETSRDVRPGGRVDHTFVYERPDVRVGEGRYRLRLVVGGDRLTALQHFVKVPEAFARRFEAMRSANNAISLISVVGLVLVYLLGCCGIGLFVLGRQRWIIWKTPVAWGVFVAFLQLLHGFNQWPLVWLDYDTAVSSGGFVAQQIGLQLLTFLGYAFLFSISFMAAESLTRRAFPRHLQLWHLWSPRVAASRAMAGRTVAGYLLVSVFLGYEVLLYFLASRGLGWWMPADTLVQPDVLAHYQPWFGAVAVSTQAGFWEEAMFRAVPLACAALLGQRYGRRGWWIAGALLLQAVIFGSGHAGYANQPAYARLVELILPSFMFGGLYLVFGLWPGIVLHFTYDATLFALPLFVSSAPGAWVDRLMVVLLVLVPLWVVLGGRRRAGAWTEAGEETRNGAWQPPAREERPPRAQVPAASLHAGLLRFLPAAGLAGLVLWVAFAGFRPDSPPLNVSRGLAEQRARQALAARGVALDGRWRALPSLDGAPVETHNFVWRTAGRDAYRRLLGQFLPAPRWTVRFVRFQGDVAERAEEYAVSVAGDGRVTRVRHTLAEAAAAPSLAEGDARALAGQTIRDRFSLDPAGVKEVEAKPSKQKNRTDWLFTFSVPVRPPLPQGEARAGVAIAGSEVSDAYRFVHVPEEWSRAERDRTTLLTVINMGCIALLVLAVIGGIIFSIVSWVRRRFSLRAFLVVALLLFAVNVVNRFNALPMVTALFSTAQPYELQLVVTAATLIIGLTLVSVAMAVLAGYVAHNPGRDQVREPARWALGASAACLAAGLGAAAASLGPSMSPAWAAYSPLAAYVPWAGPALDAVSQTITMTLAGWFLVRLVDGLTAGWTRRKAAGAGLVFVLGLVLSGVRGVDSAPGWLVAGVLIGAFALVAYYFVFRPAPEALPAAVATMLVLGAVKSALSGAYPGVVLAATLRLVMVLLTTWLLMWLAKPRAAAVAKAPAAAVEQG